MAPAHKRQKLSDGSVGAVEDYEELRRQRSLPDESHKAMPEPQHQQQRRSLFVRSLPANTTSDSLTALFSESYPVKHATAVIDPVTKQSRGYGFVTFADTEDAQRARDEFHERMLDGRKLRVEIAEPRHRDAEGRTSDSQVQPERTISQPTKLIVRNLPWSIKSSTQLERLFHSYGKVKQAYVPRKGPGLMAGFGFVIMRGRKNAEKAIDGVNGKQVDGRTIAVDWALEKSEYTGAVQEAIDASISAESQLQRADNEFGDTDAVCAGHAEGLDEQDAPAAAHERVAGSMLGHDADHADIESEDMDVDITVQGENAGNHANNLEERSTTIFVRNLPFTCTDEDLEDHFSRFGRIRYSRVVVDPTSERSKGTGFVCFYRTENADSCLRGAPKRTELSVADNVTDSKVLQKGSSVLENADADPSGQYTIGGRVLQVSRAVDKAEALRLAEEGTSHRRKQREDRRRLYLLSEGTISSRSKLWDQLPPSEKTMREASAKQRRSLIESNPSLHLSLTRLSIRNIPRTVGSKELKAIAREAVVGFATDIKSGARQPLSKEELSRGGEAMIAAEQARKRAGKGVVKQAKVVFEGAGGSKVSEDSGAGKSRGYGFIEYYTHRSALMGLRWLNGHAVGYQVKNQGVTDKYTLSKDAIQDRKKRLIVEFAIENAQVVMRRTDKETKAKERAAASKRGALLDEKPYDNTVTDIDPDIGKTARPKRKDGYEAGIAGKQFAKNAGDSAATTKRAIEERVARRNQIIGRKRAMRRARKGGKP